MGGKLKTGWFHEMVSDFHFFVHSSSWECVFTWICCSYSYYWIWEFTISLVDAWNYPSVLEVVRKRRALGIIDVFRFCDWPNLEMINPKLISLWDHSNSVGSIFSLRMWSSFCSWLPTATAHVDNKMYRMVAADKIQFSRGISVYS